MASTVGELKEQAQKYSLQGKRLQAAETYQKIILEEPANPRWPQKAGEEYRTIGRSDKAIAMFQAAAELYACQGLTLKAITLCKLVLDLDKSNRSAQRLLSSFSAGASSPPPSPTAPRTSSHPSDQPEPRCLPEPVEPPLEVIEAHDLVELLDQGKVPERQPATVAFSIPPGETLEAVDLGRAMAPAGSHSPLDSEAVEILIDEPAATAAGPAPAGPTAVSPKDEILLRLPPVPIFSFLGKHALHALVERAEVRTFSPGARLITQGEPGNSLFVLVDGEVAVFYAGPPRVELAHLGEGTFFGEIALVTKIPRTASVEAVRACQVLEISRAVFNELVQCYPEMVSVILRHLRERLVQGLVETHPLFAPFAGSERKNLIRRFSLFEAARGCVLAEEGAHAKAMYIMLCGEAESRRGTAFRTKLATGDIVGVESLLTGQPSLVSVRTLTKCWILKMREETFREVILTYSPVLATLSEIIADQGRKTAAAAAAGAFAPRGIPLY